MPWLKSPEGPVRVVLDTNVIIAAALYPSHTPGRVFSLCLTGAVQNFTSQAICTEVEDVVYRNDLAMLFPMYLAHSVLIVPTINVTLCADPDDDMFLECALAANAQFLISGDAKVLAIGILGNTRILSPKAFLEWWERHH